MLLGYPVGEEKAANNNGRIQTFQGGAIYWSQATGAMIVFDQARIQQLQQGS